MKKPPTNILRLLDAPIAFRRSFTDLTGSTTAAVLLSQALYWANRTSDADGWFWKTAIEWQEETGLSWREQASAREKLREINVLTEAIHGAENGPSCTVHYRVDQDKLKNLLQCEKFDAPIAFHRIFVEITNSVTAALMLSQAVYWTKRTADPDGWFWKTTAEWTTETGLSRREQITARQKLEDIGVLNTEARYAKNGPDYTTHYQVNLKSINILLQSIIDGTAYSTEDSRENAILDPRENAILRSRNRASQDRVFARVKIAKSRESSLYTKSTTEITTEDREREIVLDAGAHAGASAISEKNILVAEPEPNPKPKTLTVRAIRQGDETITFSTPISLEPILSPPVAPAPPSLGAAFDPVEPVTDSTHTADGQTKPNEAQKIFSDYFGSKSLSVRQWQMISETVTDIALWIRVCARWSEVYGNDWRKFGLLDWYREGIPDSKPDSKGKNNNGATKTANGKPERGNGANSTQPIDRRLQPGEKTYDWNKIMADRRAGIHPVHDDPF